MDLRDSAGTQDIQRDFRGLLQRVREGDPGAAEELVRHYEPEIRRFIRFRLTDPRLRRLIDSVDISQSVLARFFSGLASDQFDVRDPRQLMKLLTVMAQNRLLDHVRRQRTARRGSGAAADGREPDDLADSIDDPRDIVERRDLYDAIRWELNDDDRGLLDERLAGSEWSDLARERGASAEGLRKRLSRAVDVAARRLGLVDTEES